MKHTIVSMLTLIAFATTCPASYADISPSEEQEELQSSVAEQPQENVFVAEAVDESADEDMSEPQGKEVGKASTEGARTARRKQWQNIGIAVGAVAVAITALVLVSSNQGHGEHD